MSKLSFNIDQQISESMNSSIGIEKSVCINKSQLEAYRDLFFVDLHLPSGTLWARYNLGVNPDELKYKNQWYGMYYAWGETEEKESYNLTTYLHRNPSLKSDDKFSPPYNFTKYCSQANRGYKNFVDNKKDLDDKDNAVIASKSYPAFSKATMPNDNDIDELINNTTCEKVYNYNGIEGLNGYILKKSYIHDHLFIPAAGSKRDNELLEEGTLSMLWGSYMCLDFPYYASALYILFDDKQTTNTIAWEHREFGMPIRAVLHQ